MNDKEIRKFIKDKSINVDDSGRFMQEIKQQLSLLPDQSAIEDKDFLRIKTMLEAETKYYRRSAILTVALNFTYMLAIAFALLYLLPHFRSTNSAVVFATKYRYIILGISGLLISAASLRYCIKTIE